MFRFEELRIWSLSVKYGKDCYKIAGKFPKYESYSLADQLRRAGVSISSNIAEGSVGSHANFRKYLNTSIGSILETINILNFSYEIGYITEKEKMEMYQTAESLIKQIRSFLKSIN